MDLEDISARTGIAKRRLRYVLDHGLLPGSGAASRGRGSARTFTPFEAFGIVTAAALLDAGLKRALVRDCLALLCERKKGRSVAVADIPFYQAFSRPDFARLEVGDMANVRLVELPGVRKPGGTGWRQIATGAALAASYDPLVIVSVNVAAIRGHLGV